MPVTVTVELIGVWSCQRHDGCVGSGWVRPGYLCFLVLQWCIDYFKDFFFLHVMEFGLCRSRLR